MLIIGKSVAVQLSRYLIIKDIPFVVLSDKRDKITYESFYDYMIHLFANGIRSTSLLRPAHSGIERFTANRIIIRALILLSR